MGVAVLAIAAARWIGERATRGAAQPAAVGAPDTMPAAQ
jgi:hypothetical protein